MARNFMCTKTDPVVETKAGKLRGFQLDGTYAFHGVKYADAKRFHQPTPVEPWEGIKNALAYGYVCPMLQQDPGPTCNPITGPIDSILTSMPNFS